MKLAKLSAAKSKAYADDQASRVRSFHHDPLHSAVYLQELVNYLQRPFKTRRLGEIQSPLPACRRDFVYCYQLDGTKAPVAVSYDDPQGLHAALQSAHEYSDGKNELLFMCGQPSPDWLNTIGAHYQTDVRFYYQHLRFLPDSQRDWYTDTPLPSRSHDVLRLIIPTIVFVGAPKRYVDKKNLRTWRSRRAERIRDQFKCLTLNDPRNTGRSILRRVDIYNGDCMVIEQEVSLKLIRRNSNWTSKN